VIASGKWGGQKSLTVKASYKEIKSHFFDGSTNMRGKTDTGGGGGH